MVPILETVLSWSKRSTRAKVHLSSWTCKDHQFQLHEAFWIISTWLSPSPFRYQIAFKRTLLIFRASSQSFQFEFECHNYNRQYSWNISLQFVNNHPLFGTRYNPWECDSSFLFARFRINLILCWTHFTSDCVFQFAMLPHRELNMLCRPMLQTR